MNKKASSSTKAKPFPMAKIANAIKAALPSDRGFKIKIVNSGVGDAKIVRIVTDAWKSKRPTERIQRVLRAVNPKLTEDEQWSVLRYSVLTEKEYQRLVEED